MKLDLNRNETIALLNLAKGAMQNDPLGVFLEPTAAKLVDHFKAIQKEEADNAAEKKEGDENADS